MKNQYRGGDCLKTGVGQLADLSGGLARKRGVDTPMHTMIVSPPPPPKLCGGGGEFLVLKIFLRGLAFFSF